MGASIGAVGNDPHHAYRNSCRPADLGNGRRLHVGTDRMGEGIEHPIARLGAGKELIAADHEALDQLSFLEARWPRG